MSDLSNYLDETRSWAEEAAIVLQERAALEYSRSRRWRDDDLNPDLAYVSQNDAMGVAAHARIAYARAYGHAPDPLDVDLTSLCALRDRIQWGHV